MKSKIITRILIIGIVLLTIGLVVACILYFTTDLLKPANKVFMKYYEQNLAYIDSILDFSKEDNHIKILKEKNYNDTTNINIMYTNSRNDIENFDITSTGDTDNLSKKNYREINIKNNDNKIIDAELIKENQYVSVLLKDIIKKSVCIDINNMDLIYNKLEIDKNSFEKYKIINLLGNINENKKIIEQELSTYINEINSKQYSVNKGITVNTTTPVVADAYSLKLSNEQTKKIYNNILKKLGKTDKIEPEKIFSETTITMYITDQKTVMISLESGEQKIEATIEKNIINIKYTKTTENNIESINLSIKNENNNKIIEYKDNYKNIILQTSIEQDETTSKALINLKFSNENIKQLEINTNQNLSLNNSVNIEKTIDSNSIVLLNELETYNLKVAINSLLQRINNNLNNNSNSEIIDIIKETIKNEDDKFKQTKANHINNFNNQLLSYKGQNINQNVLQNMLDYVGNHILEYKFYGNNLKIFLKEGNKDTKKIEEIKSKIKNIKGSYNINYQYDSEGKISVILMENISKR